MGQGLIVHLSMVGYTGRVSPMRPTVAGYRLAQAHENSTRSSMPTSPRSEVDLMRELTSRRPPPARCGESATDAPARPAQPAPSEDAPSDHSRVLVADTTMGGWGKHAA
jgi:hypothetical protein